MHQPQIFRIRGATRQMFVILAAIVIVAAAVRFPSLRTSPPWYTDETFYLNNAWELAHGHATVSGIGQWTFISAFSTIPPLFHFILVPLLLIFGKSLLVARSLTASVGVLTAVSLGYIGYAMFRSRLAGLVMGLAYATIPVIVVNNRVAFPQNLAGLFLLWAAFWLWQYRSTGRRAYELAGCLAAGAALTTTYWCWGFLVAVFVLFRGLPRRRAWQAAGMILALPIAVLAIRALTVPVRFWNDVVSIGLMMANVNTATPLWIEFLLGSGQYFTRDPLFPLALVGMLAVRPYRLRIFLAAAFGGAAIVLLMKRLNFANWFYSGLTFTPLLLLGLGAGMAVLKNLAGTNWRRIAAVLIAAIGAYSAVHIWGIYYALNRHQIAKLASSHEFVTREDSADIDRVVGFINLRVSPQDFVIAPNTVNWQIRSRAVEAMWVGCYEHRQEFGNYFQDRFPAPIGIHSASFLVDDNVFGGDAGICAEWRPEVLATAQAEHWPLVLATGRYNVYQNPNPTSIP